MIVTLDGPAGAGKSTAARALARRLEFRYLDTGAMYRAVTLAAVRSSLNWDDLAALAALSRRLAIELRDDQVWLDGQDVTADIRRSEITELTFHAAGNPDVRSHLVEVQRRFAGDSDVVAEGRDQGTVVFPQAECKIFLTASAEARALRRQQELLARGEDVPFEEVLRQQIERDFSDSNRSVGPLVPAADAVHFYTDGLTADDVVDQLEAIVRKKIGNAVHTPQRTT